MPLEKRADFPQDYTCLITISDRDFKDAWDGVFSKLLNNLSSNGVAGIGIISCIPCVNTVDSGSDTCACEHSKFMSAGQ